MVPTLERNHSAILISYNNENLLFDCGEGTQKQFRKAKISPAKITRILLTHWHGDHVFGIPGLLTTMSWSNYARPFEIYGPKGTKKHLENLMKGFIQQGDLKSNTKEVTSGKVFETNEFYIEAFPLSHGCPCLAYNFIEKDKRNIDMKYIKKFGLKNNPILRKLSQGKDIIYNNKKISAKKATRITKGKKISIILDTSFNKNLIKIAKNADILICESTHLSGTKEAASYKHLTSEQAALIAKKAKAKKLILTHFSQRYKDITPLEKEAKKIFKNTISSKDLMEVIV
jgi:ribonuclease Z